VSVAPPDEVFRAALRESGYEMTGEIGNCETWTPPSLSLIEGGGHVFYVRAGGTVTYVAAKQTRNDLSFEEATSLIEDTLE